MFDMVQVYKILNNIGELDISLSKISENVLARMNTRSQSDPMNLVKKRRALDIIKIFFTERVVNLWNGLPMTVKHATTLKAFKNELKNVW